MISGDFRPYSLPFGAPKSPKSPKKNLLGLTGDFFGDFGPCSLVPFGEEFVFFLGFLLRPPPNPHGRRPFHSEPLGGGRQTRSAPMPSRETCFGMVGVGAGGVQRKYFCVAFLCFFLCVFVSGFLRVFLRVFLVVFRWFFCVFLKLFFQVLFGNEENPRRSGRWVPVFRDLFVL